jgi:hypothetical protein
VICSVCCPTRAAAGDTPSHAPPRIQVEALHRLVQELQPAARGSIQRQLDRLWLRQVVVDHDRHGDFIAARQRYWQIQVDEERLKDADRLLDATEPPVGGNRTGREAQVVMESASSTSSDTRPWSSVISSGRHSSVSGTTREPEWAAGRRPQTT